MQILLPLLVGAVYGAVLHYLMSGRDSRGAALSPILGAVVGGLVWLIMTWAGVTIESPWIWIASIAAPAAIVPITLVVLRRVRAEADANERIRLRIA